MDWADKTAAKCVSDGMGDGDTMRLIAAAVRAERDACAKVVEAAVKAERMRCASGRESVSLKRQAEKGPERWHRP